MYKGISSLLVMRLSDGAVIPFDEENTDFRQYQTWLAEGNVPEPADGPTPAEIYATWKAERAQKVASLTVEVDGMIFDGDETSQNRMARVVIAANDPADTTYWTLHDNRVELVTAAQLKAACRLAGEEQTRIWNEGRPA